eukprot:1160000-Pelagomonas_calceolata.AAC.8
MARTSFLTVCVNEILRFDQTNQTVQNAVFGGPVVPLCLTSYVSQIPMLHAAPALKNPQFLSRHPRTISSSLTIHRLTKLQLLHT